MIQVREFTNGADVLAHAAEIRRKFYPPRRMLPTQVHLAPVNEAFVASGTQAPREEFQPVSVMHVPTVEEIVASFRLVHSSEPAESVTLRDLLQCVSDVFGIPLNEMKSARRATPLVNARHAFFFLARGLTERSFPQIGLYCGGRDHTTVIHGVRRCEKLMAEDEKFRSLVHQAASHFGGEQ